MESTSKAPQCQTRGCVFLVFKDELCRGCWYMRKFPVAFANGSSWGLTKKLFSGVYGLAAKAARVEVMP